MFQGPHQRARHFRLEGVVAGAVDQAQPAPGQRLVQALGIAGAAHEVEPAVEEGGGNAGHAARGLEHGVLAEEAAMGEVVCLYAIFVDQRPQRLGVTGGRGRRRSRGGDHCLLPSRPGLRGTGGRARIGAGERGAQRGERPALGRFRYRSAQRGPGLGADRARALGAEEPVEVGLPGEEAAAQDCAQAAVGVGAAPGHRERRPPRTAEHQPALDPKVQAQALDVLDQLAGGVGVAAATWRAASAAALVEEDDVKAGGVEELAMARAAAAARPTMKKQHGQTVGIAAALEVEAVAVADVEQAVRERWLWREEGDVGCHGVGSSSGNVAG